jgi:DNA-binding NtrC family response regulator
MIKTAGNRFPESPSSIVNFDLTDGMEKVFLPRAEKNQPTRQRSSQVSLELIGVGLESRMLRNRIEEIAANDHPVSIQGEPGTGKSFVARIVHVSGRRARRPFLTLDCKVLSQESFRRELFGERARNSSSEYSIPSRQGRLQQVDGGTLLLENIDMLALPLQKEVNRSLFSHRQECASLPKRIVPDLRILVTSKANLDVQTRQGRFQKQLFEKLCVQPMTIPPLRERIEDTGLFTEHFLNQLSVREGRPTKRLTLDSLELIEKYYWPENLRELQNVIERACLLDLGPKLTADMLRPWLGKHSGDAQAESLGMTLKEMERKLIETTFARCHGNRERTAKILDIGLRTLSGKLREFGYPPRGGPGSNLKVAFPKAA